MSTQQIITNILRKTIGTVPRVTPTARSQNAAFRFSFGGNEFILKLAGKDRRATEKEKNLIQLAGRRGVPVPLIEHADTDGTVCGYPFLILRSAGDLDLSQWRERVASDPAERGTLIGAYRCMGNLLAAIHSIEMERAGEIIGREFRPSDPVGFMAGVAVVGDELVRANILDAACMETFRYAAMPPTGGRSLCHSDYRDTQCVVAGGRITAIIDWESAWSGNRLIDFAIARTHLELSGRHDLLDAFVGGYASKFRLSDSFEADYRIVFMATVLALVRAWSAAGIPLDHPQMRPRLERAARLFESHACATREGR